MRRSNSALKSRRRQRLSIDVLEDRRLLATITVNTAADDPTATASLSLRQAIEVSDGTLSVSSLSTQQRAQVSGAVGATNAINFNIPTTDQGYNATTKVWTIAVNSELPAISINAAIIDGYTQPGASPNTLAQGDNAVLKIALSGAGQGQIDGLTIAQEGSQVSGLDIEDFGSGGYTEDTGADGYGIVVTAAGNVQVAGCFIGTDSTGEIAAPNANGVEIETSSNLIGGSNVGDRNVISGNSAPYAGVGLFFTSEELDPLGILPTGNLVENNFIGVDAAGAKALANQFAGVVDDGTANTYGGTTAGLGNVISGNGGGGLRANGSVIIEGNFIGTDATGNVALGNGPVGEGISDAPYPDATVAITTTIADNLVSGNLGDGVGIGAGLPSSSVYTISNNRIGTNAAGTAALGNGDGGLFLSGIENSTVLDNLISGNGGPGMELTGVGTEVEHDVIQGNKIGTDITGLIALGNYSTGTFFNAAVGNTFGGSKPGQGNLVAFNGGDGIDEYGGGQNQFIQNSIFGNGLVGIVSNQLLAAPTLTFTPGSGNSGTLSGTLIGTPGADYVVEIFSNPTTATVGHEQGKTFIQDVVVIPTGSGSGTFSLTFPTGIYTATATDAIGNTSAFSNAVGTQQALPVTTTVSPSSGSLPTQTVNPSNLPATTTTLASSSNPSAAGQQVTFTAVVAAPGFAGTPTGTVTFTIDGQAQAPVPLAVVGHVDEAKFVTSTLTTGPHSITAAYSGNSTVAPSAVASPLVQVVDAVTTTITAVAAPRVMLVQRFGVHMHPTVLVLSFDTALDPASATSLQNYVLVGPKGSHIKFKSVSYDSSAHTVTLRPTVKINVHRTYRLTVIGNDPHGVCGVDRALLAGAGDGQPGTDFVTSVTWRNAVINANQARVLDQWLDQEFGGRR
jgi:hypothetical protein